MVGAKTLVKPNTTQMPINSFAKQSYRFRCGGISNQLDTFTTIVLHFCALSPPPINTWSEPIEASYSVCWHFLPVALNTHVMTQQMHKFHKRKICITAPAPQRKIGLLHYFNTKGVADRMCTLQSASTIIYMIFSCVWFTYCRFQLLSLRSKSHTIECEALLVDRVIRWTRNH